jgi:4-diphosphocytidyl-2-C-methyl-D-erythritol kinase
VTVLTARAPGKVNLSLYVGAPRADGLHPLRSVVQSVSLADELTMEPFDGPADEVVCAGVEGPNLALAALSAFRAATDWDGPPQRLTITKRVPVAAGMGGGSGDAAAALRLAAHAAGGADAQLLLRLAARLGADVSSQVVPGRTLMTGAGEHVERLPDPEPFGLLIAPSPHALSTPEVYRAFDRLCRPRGADELEELDEHAVHNDLQPAAIALCPPVAQALEEMRERGAAHALVSGSGPTVFGLFATPAAAEAAAGPGTIAATPVGADFGAVA